MENQHRRIKGYRELSLAEIAMMNAIKIKGAELGELINRMADDLLKEISAVDLEDDDAHNAALALCLRPRNGAGLAPITFSKA